MVQTTLCCVRETKIRRKIHQKHFSRWNNLILSFRSSTQRKVASFSFYQIREQHKCFFLLPHFLIGTIFSICFCHYTLLSWLIESSVYIHMAYIYTCQLFIWKSLSFIPILNLQTNKHCSTFSINTQSYLSLRLLTGHNVGQFQYKPPIYTWKNKKKKLLFLYY